MQPKSDQQQKWNAQFEAFRFGDGADIADVIARFGIVLICGVALWYVTDQMIMLAWCFGYCAMNLVYIFGILRRKKGDIRRADVVLCIFFSALIAAWYCAMIVYVASLRDGDFVFLAACGVLGLALHGLSRNVEFSYSAYIDFVAVIATGLGVTAFAAGDASTQGSSIAILIGGLCSTAYFWLSFHHIINVNRALAKKRREEAQNQKMLALGQLASGVAHDFNNLLTVIRGNIELSMLETTNQEIEDFLTEAKVASDKSAVLIRQLLAYGRKSELRISTFNLGTLLKEIHFLLVRVIPAYIDLEIHHPSQVPDLRTDRALLETALINLVINAQKAIGDKTGHIQISIESDPAEKQILIHVSDTGPGMSPDVLARATEPFFTTRHVGEGSGLGLSMVNGFATQSGGSLRFTNLEDGRFRVTMKLPVSNYSD